MYHHSSVSNHSPISFSYAHFLFTSYTVYPIWVNDISLIQPEILRAESLESAIGVSNFSIGMQEVFGRFEDQDG
jgi:hypothetical protein